MSSFLVINGHSKDKIVLTKLQMNLKKYKIDFILKLVLIILNTIFFKFKMLMD